MISADEEARMLLNKWISEASPIVAIQAFPFPLPDRSQMTSCSVARISGRITSLDSTGVFVLRGEQTDDFLIASVEGCSFGYEGKNIPLLSQSDFIKWPEDWDSLLYVQFPGGGALALYAVEG
jgi:hypothetical protein